MITRRGLSAHRLLAALAVTCYLWQQVPSAHAQSATSQLAGTLSSMPAPMVADGDLSSLTRALTLSDAQGAAVREPLRRYWDAWRAVQDAEFTTYSAREAEVSMMPWRRPETKTVKEFNAQSQRIERRLRDAETVLFLDIAEVLSDEQLPLLEEVRIRRDREFLTCDHLAAAWFKDRPPLDIADLLARCDISTQLIGNDVIISYNLRMKELLQRLGDAIVQARDCWMERTDNAPFAAIDPNASMEELARHREVLHAWSDCLRPVSEVVSECFGMSREVVRRISMLLSPDDSRLFEASYLAYEFGGVFPRNLALECVLLETGRSDDAETTAREQLGEAYERWIREMRPMEWAISDGLTAARVRMPPGLQISMGRPSPAEEERMRAVPSAEALYAETQGLIFNSKTLPTSIVKNIHARVWQERVLPMQSRSGSSTLERSTLVKAPAGVPAPLSIELISHLAAETGRWVDANSVAAAIDAYSPKYQESMNELRTINASAVGPLSRKNLDQTRERLMKSTGLSQRLIALDSEAIAGASIPPDIALFVQLHRASEWANYEKLANGASLLGAAVDFTYLLDIPDFDSADSARARAILVDQAPGLLTAFNGYLASLMRLREAAELASASRWLRPEAALVGEDASEAWRSVRQLQADCEADQKAAEEKAGRAHVQLLSVERAVIDQLCATVSESSAAALRQAFAAAVFPNALAVLSEARARLKRAMSLPSLLVEQRARLNDAAIDFNAECERTLDESVSMFWSLVLSQKGAEGLHSSPSLQVEQLGLAQRRIANRLYAKMREILTNEQASALGMDQAGR